jgi:hypothetical protein
MANKTHRLSCLALAAALLGSTGPALGGGAVSYRLGNPAPTAQSNFGVRSSAVGSRLAVGCPAEFSETEVGRVDFFDFDGTGWSFNQSLVAPDGFAGDAFGQLVVRSGDRLFVSAIHDDDGGFWTGAVYVFDVSGTTPTLVQKVRPTTSVAGAQFGLDLALSHDGATMVVGASNETNQSGFAAGAAYVFERGANGLYQQVSRLLPGNGCTACFYGRSIAVRNDMMVIGALGASGQFPQDGRVDIFFRTPSGWPSSPSQILTSPRPETSGTFGQFVSLGGDRLAVNGLRSVDGGDTAGTLHLFTIEDGGFILEAEVVSSSVSAQSSFGYPCILNEDGTLLLAGAFTDSTVALRAGAVVAFDLSTGKAVETHVLRSSAPRSEEYFGTAIDYDRGRVWIGAPLHQIGAIAGAGAVYGFDLYQEADMTHDGVIDARDLARLLASWGPTGPTTVADLDGNGVVDGEDLVKILSAWGT